VVGPSRTPPYRVSASPRILRVKTSIDFREVHFPRPSCPPARHHPTIAGSSRCHGGKLHATLSDPSSAWQIIAAITFTPSASSTAVAATLSLPPSSPHLNQSLSSSALANPSNIDLMALRLPKPTAITYLIAPSFPGLSSTLADRFFHIFDYHSYGTSLDYSEYLVMIFTLWYGHAHEELTRFLFTLVDVGANGKVGRKEYRKVAQALLEEYANKADSGVASTTTTAPPASTKDKNTASAVAGGSGGESREYLGPLFDLYFHLALFQHDRDHDKMLSPAEFANFAEEDILLTALVHGRKDPRQAKQRVRELLGAKGNALLPTTTTTPTPLQKKLPNTPASSTSAAVSAAATAAAAVSSTASAPPPGLTSLSLTRNFLGEEEVEETSGAIWRQQRRSNIKHQIRRNGGITTPATGIQPNKKSDAALTTPKVTNT
jgi:hypothetical protein